MDNRLTPECNDYVCRSRQTTQLSQQECFQLLSRSTQVFREEYIQKQALARQEIRRRYADIVVKILRANVKQC